MKWYLKVLRQYANFSGNARREEFWMFMLFHYIIIIILSSTIYYLLVPYFLATFLPFLAVSVRRLHDTNRSGWWMSIILALLAVGAVGIFYGIREQLSMTLSISASLVAFAGFIWFIVLMLPNGNYSKEKEEKEKEEEEKALKAIEATTDQKKLAKAAKTDERCRVRKAAVEKLTDQPALAKVAKKDPDSAIRRIAVEKLTDESVLADVAKNDKDWDVRKAAVGKLTDKFVLADIAKNDKNWDIAITACKRLGIKTNIMGHLLSLKSSLDSRKNAARELIKLLQNDPELASILWKRVSAITKVAHDDRINHYDITKYSPGGNSDCHDDHPVHTDNNSHTDYGIGVEFPPYPFND